MQNDANYIRRVTFNVGRILADPTKLEHIFGPKHGLEVLGTRAEALARIGDALSAAGRVGALPQSGLFTVTRIIQGATVVIRGAIVNGEIRIGTVFIPR